jgi:hypothetical protein
MFWSAFNVRNCGDRLFKFSQFSRMSDQAGMRKRKEREDDGNVTRKRRRRFYSENAKSPEKDIHPQQNIIEELAPENKRLDEEILFIDNQPSLSHSSNSKLIQVESNEVEEFNQNPEENEEVASLEFAVSLIVEDDEVFESHEPTDTFQIIRRLVDFSGEALTVLSNLLSFSEFFLFHRVCKSWNSRLKSLRCIEKIILSRAGDVSKALLLTTRRFASVKDLSLSWEGDPYDGMDLLKPRLLLSFKCMQRLQIDIDFRRCHRFTSFWNCISQMTELKELNLLALPNRPSPHLKFKPGLVIEVSRCFRTFQAHIVDTIRLLPYCGLAFNHWITETETLYYKPSWNRYWHVKKSESALWFEFENLWKYLGIDVVDDVTEE